MYQLSTDFDRLFDLLLKGQEILGFVDYDGGGGKPWRDVCRIRRLEGYRIIASCRGITYFSVDPWLKEDSALSEREIFCGMCQDANLEWVEQSNSALPPDPLGMQLCQAFLQGAKFWEFAKTGATMWQSDQFAAFKEAIRLLRGGSLGVVPPPDKKIFDEVMRNG